MIQVSSTYVNRESVGVVVSDAKDGRSRTFVVDILIDNNAENCLERITLKSKHMYYLSNRRV
jgi:hypothetical protein